MSFHFTRGHLAIQRTLSADLPSSQVERLVFDPVTGLAYSSITGLKVTLRGWNWGRWGKVQPGEGARNAAEGSNHVRIVFRWWGLYDNNINDVDAYNPAALTTALIDPAHLALMDWYMALAVSAGLWITFAFDSNCGQNGAQDANSQLYCTVAGAPAQNFWNNLGMRAQFKAAWAFMRNRYRNVTRIAYWEILPEPGPPGYSDADVKAFYADMYPAFAADTPNTPTLIGPNGAYLASKLPTVYDPVLFPFTGYTADYLDAALKNKATLPGKLAPLLALRALGANIYINQIGKRSAGDDDGSLLDNGLNLAVTNEISYAQWAYRGSTATDQYEPWINSGDDVHWILKTGPWYGISLTYFQLPH